jgi:hypothetical protein
MTRTGIRVVAYLGQVAVGFAEQEHRAFDAAAQQVSVRGLAERGAERADEVRRGDRGDPGGAGSSSGCG